MRSTEQTAGTDARGSDLAIALCFLGSGATSLAMEVLWVRQLSLVFGSTTFAVSTVVGVFMGGLALGAWWIGRRADSWESPLRAYGRLELAIAAYAICVPLLFAALVPVYRWSWALFGQATQRSVRVPGALFGAGIALFAGSLYALALGGPRLLGPLTPLGGSCLVAGWLSLPLLARTPPAGGRRRSDQEG